MSRRTAIFIRNFMLAGMAAGTLSLATPVQTQTIDSIITGSIGQSAPGPFNPDGSRAFQSAVDLLLKGKYTDAYQAARGFPDDAERRAVQWAAIYFGRGDIDYETVQRFQADAPHFATASTYKTRLEQSLVKLKPGGSTVISLLGGQMPNTIDAQLALASAYVADGQAERAGRIVRDVWVNNNLDQNYEKRILSQFGSLLGRDAHWDRAVRLLMHDRASGTERIMHFLSPAQKSLALARIAVSRKAGNAQNLLDRVDPAYRDHPLFHFARGQNAHDRGALTAAVDFLNAARGEVPEAEEWWYERRNLARKLLAAGEHRAAYLAAAGYTNGPEGRMVDAQFHAGWIALDFLRDAKTARIHFERQAKFSTLPTSITSSHYWLGRANEAMGDSRAARDAYGVAARYGQQYYGQLARAKLGLTDVGLRGTPDWRWAEARFDQIDLVRAIRMLENNRAGGMAETLLTRLAYQLNEPADLLLAARLAQEIGAHHLAILIADIADGRGTALDPWAFPKDGIPSSYRTAEVDRAAIYAVARQESRFDTDAQSWAGARGLMQLMPATARETAGWLGQPYSASRLTSDPAYNTLLGSTYLAKQLDVFDGSLVLAAAAYNAGAGNAKKWIAAYGDPRSPNVDPVTWIELIPFTETRGYVQKVMGNYQVYRARLGDDTLRINAYLRRIPH